jgi:Domain of unknown function (DUF4422)
MEYIKIFQSFHKDYPRNQSCAWITPIGVSGYLEEGLTSDCTGENISSLNAAYCELTTQFYAWKNTQSNFVGFFHYRRYLNFQVDNSIYDSVIPGQKWYEPTSEIIEYLTSQDQYKSLQNLLEHYDVITPNKYIMAPNIRDQYYINTTNHEPWVEFMDQMERIYKNSSSYFTTMARAPICNMFVMKRDLFNAYCSDLFPVIDKVYKKLGQPYDQQNNRYPGFLAERFLGFWLATNKISYAEVPLIAFK